MHSLPFRQKFRLLTVMAAPAANEAQPQGPQVPRVPQANVVQHILAERPPQKPIFDTNALEVMCLSFFHTSLALLPLFMCTCRHVLICPFPPSSLLSSFSPFFCVVYLHSSSFTLLLPLLSFQAFCSSFQPPSLILLSSVQFPHLLLFSVVQASILFSSLFILSFFIAAAFCSIFCFALPPFTFIYLFLSSWLTLFIALLSAFCAICFSFQFFRHEKFFGLFVCFLMTDVIYCIPIAFCSLCFRLEKFSLLLPRSRCNSLHFSGFFAISISLRFCQFLVYQFVLFLITGVLSHCYTFSLKLLLCFSFLGMRSSFICLFPHGRGYSSYFYYFYIQEILPGTIALVFRFPFTDIQFIYYHTFVQ